MHRRPATWGGQLHALALAVLQLGWAHSLWAADSSGPAPTAAATTAAAPGGAAATRPRAPREALPLFFEADELGGESGASTRAQGRVRVIQGEMSMRADQVLHDGRTNTATAQGDVRIRTGGNVFAGPALRLQLDTEVGEFTEPRFWLTRLKAGGSAQRIEFLGQNRLQAFWTTYSSCTPASTADGEPGQPDWALKTSKVWLDLEASEGRAEDAVIWFKGVPLLAAPKLSFPLDDKRKSGLLPPSIDFSSTSGFKYSQPYYWNIAPNQDMTVAMQYASRRGASVDTEYRYLLPNNQGNWRVVALPGDRVTLRSRGLADLRHVGFVEGAGSADSRTDFDLRWQRVSDDNYWKDFAHNLPSLTPRLYDSHARFEHTLNARNWGLGTSQTMAYGSVQRWQTLKDLTDTTTGNLSRIVNPYQREPQLGLISRNGHDAGLLWSAQAEFNRFTHPDVSLQSGNRVQVQGQISRPFMAGGITFTPKVALRSTSYDLAQPLANGRGQATRTVPTFSLDGTTTLERQVNWFDQPLTQTLEPRVQYVRTAFRDQSGLPLFDTAPRDFNQYAIFNENAFTGGDRINDAHQITLGLTSRLLKQKDGSEAMRVGVVQRVLLADQRINPEGDGPITQRLSDQLLLASTSVLPGWWLDGTTQLNAQTHAVQRGLLSMRYSPGPWRTVNVNYRYTRDAAEQVQLGWQWPLSGSTPRNDIDTSPAWVQSASHSVQGSAPSPTTETFNFGRATARGGSDCQGSWYSVGRLSYSTRDRRMTDALMGVEYDAGCWIGRVVAQRLSVGATQASTRIMFQLELIGLSKIALGSNPLKPLKDNIPGYRLLRDPKQTATTPTGESPLLDDE